MLNNHPNDLAQESCPLGKWYRWYKHDYICPDQTNSKEDYVTYWICTKCAAKLTRYNSYEGVRVVHGWSNRHD